MQRIIKILRSGLLNDILNVYKGETDMNEEHWDLISSEFDGISCGEITGP